jgi:plasmid replication initiation protein
MSLTFQEVCEELQKLDEITLLETLEISSEEIVNHFQDKIEDKIETLAEDLEDPTMDLFNQDLN